VQLRHFVKLQEELAINYCHLAVVSVDAPEVSDAFRTGLGANFPFLSDHERKVVKLLDMTETSKSRGVTAIPYTFCLLPDLTVHSVYCGYWYVGRPTLQELRMDLREMMKKVRPDFDPQA
jgi:peroxiredoxin